MSTEPPDGRVKSEIAGSDREDGGGRGGGGGGEGGGGGAGGGTTVALKLTEAEERAPSVTL
ncbi:MAG: hypothetical protein F4156_16425 [Holophagales bacterium]|nr:hypothetical protein [Holophagales bacterium]